MNAGVALARLVWQEGANLTDPWFVKINKLMKEGNDSHNFFNYLKIPLKSFEIQPNLCIFMNIS